MPPVITTNLIALNLTLLPSSVCPLLPLSPLRLATGVGGVPFVLGSLAAGAAVSAGCFYKSWKIPEDVLDKIAAQEKAEKIAKAASIAATKKALVAQVRAEHNSA